MSAEAVSKVEFLAQVSGAFGKVYDLVYLRKQPLLDMLVPDAALPREARAWRMHRILLEAIEELDPGPKAPVLSNEYRRHQLMALTYLDGLASQDVASRLGISRRHYYREHDAAVRAVGEILWDRYAAPAMAPVPQPVGEPAHSQPLSRLELLRQETARIAQAARFAPIDSVITGVLSVLRQQLQQRQLAVDSCLTEGLPGTPVDQNLVRQLLLGILGCLIERTEAATIRLHGQTADRAVILTLSVAPGAARQPTTALGIHQRLASLEDLAGLSGAAIRPLGPPEAIEGFELTLPQSSRHSVLIVDDNDDVLELMQRYLQLHGFQPITARTASQALDLARHHQPFAITLDLMLPGQDGWDILQSLLNHHRTRHIPVIVCSVLSEKDLALSLGATAFLDKPVTEQALLSALHALA